MEYRYELEADSIMGTNADTWTDFAEQLAAWLEEGPSLDFETFEEQSRAFAVRAVMIAGGTRRRID